MFLRKEVGLQSVQFLLLLDKSDFRLSFGGKEALYGDKPPVTVFVRLIFVKHVFEI